MISRWMKVGLVALGLSVVPVSYALADAGGDGAIAAQAGKGGEGRKEKGKDRAKNFPMEGAKFLANVDARIAKRRTHLDERMDKKSVPADKQQEVLRDYDAGSAKIRSAAEVAAKDGTVTVEEAKSVRTLAKDTRQAMREKYGMPSKDKAAKDKAGNGNGKAKGKSKSKDKGKGNGQGKGKGKGGTPA